MGWMGSIEPRREMGPLPCGFSMGLGALGPGYAIIMMEQGELREKSVTLLYQCSGRGEMRCGIPGWLCLRNTGWDPSFQSSGLGEGMWMWNNPIQGQAGRDSVAKLAWHAV